MSDPDLGSYDVVVVGAGLAGLTAGLFAARQGRSTLVLEMAAPGGHLTSVNKIEDFPGFPEGVAGYELCPSVQEQAAKFGAHFELAQVETVEPADEGWRVVTDSGAFGARAVVVATGSHPKALGLPGEEGFEGRGISHCASCDAPLFRGQPVAVVGGGDSAWQEALTAAEFASTVTLLHREADPFCQATYAERVRETPNIEVRSGTVVTEVVGGDTVTGLRIREGASGAEQLLDVAAAFVYVGLEPATGLLKDLGILNEDGRVPTDVWMRTRRPGLFAAGDIRADSASQAITSAGDGATAAVGAHRYLLGEGWPVS